jgi:site-specific DNA-cytosine methylase
VGGGTLSQAFASNPKFKLILGLEIEPNYSDVWERAHPQAELWSADMRLVHPTEVPEHDVFIAGIPCDDHSNMGRAKKKLAGKPESGEKGDLFLSITSLISHHMPNAVVVENVVSYGSSMAGTSLRVHLERMGYQCVEHILDPNAQWDEPSDRKRWILIALLKEGFALHVPNTPFAGQACDYLDPANPEQDEREARHIAATIVGLRAHNKRHAAQGHGFAMTCLNGNETKIPTIPKSYHKINTGPFVNTPFGPRMLRKHEIERIMGATIDTPHYATAVQILGQGVQTRIFRDIFQQLGDFLDGTTPPAESQPLMVAPLTLPTVQSFIPAAPAGQLALL